MLCRAHKLCLFFLFIFCLGTTENRTYTKIAFWHFKWIEIVFFFLLWHIFLPLIKQFGSQMQFHNLVNTFKYVYVFACTIEQFQWIRFGVWSLKNVWSFGAAYIRPKFPNRTLKVSEWKFRNGFHKIFNSAFDVLNLKKKPKWINCFVESKKSKQTKKKIY